MKLTLKIKIYMKIYFIIKVDDIQIRIFYERKLLSLQKTSNYKQDKSFIKLKKKHEKT